MSINLLNTFILKKWSLFLPTSEARNEETSSSVWLEQVEGILFLSWALTFCFSSLFDGSIGLQTPYNSTKDTKQNKGPTGRCITPEKSIGVKGVFFFFWGGGILSSQTSTLQKWQFSSKLILAQVFYLTFLYSKYICSGI